MRSKILSLILDNIRQNGLINEDCLNIGILNDKSYRIIESKDLPKNQIIITNIGSPAFPRYEYAFPLYYFKKYNGNEISRFGYFISTNITKFKKVKPIKYISSSALYYISDLVNAKIITEIW